MTTINERQLAATLTLALASVVERTDDMMADAETDWIWGTYLNFLGRVHAQTKRVQGD